VSESDGATFPLRFVKAACQRRRRLHWSRRDRCRSLSEYRSPDEQAAFRCQSRRSRSMWPGRRCLADPYDEKHALIPEGSERMELHVGNRDLPLQRLIV
jgi:hypothetical protein